MYVEEQYRKSKSISTDNIQQYLIIFLSLSDKAIYTDVLEAEIVKLFLDRS